MNKFDKLPTEKCFMNLEPEQKYAIFKGINLLPKLEETSRRIKINERIKEVEDADPEKLISKGALKRMKEEYKTQGLDKKKIDEAIEKYLGALKKRELTSLEKEIDA